VSEPASRPAPLRVVVADDQAIVRDGLVVLLSLADGIEVVGSAANGQEALDVVERTRPDVILLDLRMPVLDGIEATRLLSTRHPEVAVVVLTTYADDASIVDALEAGASSYLTKNADRADIAQTLHSAATGLSVIDPAVRATLLKAAAARRRRPPERTPSGELPDGLTQREAEILSMIAQGKTNPRHRRRAVPQQPHRENPHQPHLRQDRFRRPRRRHPLRPRTPTRMRRCGPRAWPGARTAVPYRGRPGPERGPRPIYRRSGRRAAVGYGGAVGLHLSQIDEADELLTNDLLALLIGMVLDQQIGQTRNGG